MSERMVSPTDDDVRFLEGQISAGHQVRLGLLYHNGLAVRDPVIGETASVEGLRDLLVRGVAAMTEKFHELQGDTQFTFHGGVDLVAFVPPLEGVPTYTRSYCVGRIVDPTVGMNGRPPVRRPA